MIVYKTSDKIPVKIGDLTFMLSPMKWAHKQEIADLIKKRSGNDVLEPVKEAFLTLKYSVKAVRGAKCADGTDYELPIDENGIATDEGVEDLFQFDSVPSLITVALTWFDKVKEIKLDGVSVDFGAVETKKKPS